MPSPGHSRTRTHTITGSSISPLAPSPRITAYLLRRGRIPASSMAVVPVDTTLKVPPPDPVEEPPKVAVTPCDPWPIPYYFEGGLRRVKPYYYTYNTYCKERWRGRQLQEIFTSEFRDRPAEYYVGRQPVNEIERGR